MIYRALLGALTLISGLTIINANTISVTNTNDSGAGSLRQAITTANTNAGADTITFNISGAGQKTITILSDLPDITDTVTIDGGNGGVASSRVQISGGGSVGTGFFVTAPGCEIRNLVINGFNTREILAGNLTGCTIKGCILGLNPAGTAIVAGSGHAIETFNVSTLIIGGSTAPERNVMSAIDKEVLFLNGSTLTVQGNYIGLNAAGTAVVGAPPEGVAIVNGVGATIGGTNPGEGNVIVAFRGITFGGNPALDLSSGTVQGNFIGTNAAGDAALNLGNGGGVELGHAANVIINGGNVISGNNIGVRISSNGALSNSNIVQGNFIGTAANGVSPLGNSTDGVDIFNSPDNHIGGTNPGEGNVIAFNGGPGVRITDETGNLVEGNSIFSNGGLGIDLQDPGPTLNDDGDADTGGNNLQNFPVLTSVTNSGGMTTIAGRLNSAASTQYRIEFFANDAIDSTGYGEGQTFLGFVNAATDVSGDASFNKMVTQIGAGQRVTATATDPAGNTSEFSGAIGQLLNVSTRMQVLTGGSVLIGGFIIGGTGNKNVLLRALGPTLSQFGIADPLQDPTIELHAGNGSLISSNDNWKDTQQAAIMATGKAPPDDKESAILSNNLAPGNYTAIVRGKNNTTGVGLVEAYDLDESVPITLTNISTRGFVDTGQNVMIAGFISGDGIVRVIVRALGPTLAQFGVPNVLADPVLDVRDAQGTSLATNDNWKDTQQAEIQASGKAPPNDNESAIIIVRPAANTTAIVSGKNNTTGNALVEAYILPP